MSSGPDPEISCTTDNIYYWLLGGVQSYWMSPEQLCSSMWTMKRILLTLWLVLTHWWSRAFGAMPNYNKKQHGVYLARMRNYLDELQFHWHYDTRTKCLRIITWWYLVEMHIVKFVIFISELERCDMTNFKGKGRLQCSSKECRRRVFAYNSYKQAICTNTKGFYFTWLYGFWWDQ